MDSIIAAQSSEFRTAAYNELSKIYLRGNDWSKATAYAEKSLQVNKGNIDGIQVMIVIARLKNDLDKMRQLINDLNEVDPLNHFVDFEKYLLDHAEKSKESFVTHIQNEMPQQTFLELAIWYHQVGRDQEAMEVLSFAQPSAEVSYWSAFLKNEPVALKLKGPEIDFPFRDETADVLKALIKSNPHWLLKYHLALIEWNRNNIAEAKALFTQCGDEPTLASFYAAKASLMKDTPEVTEANLQQAVKLEPNEWRYPKLLTEHFIAQRKFEKALSVIEPFYKSHTNNYIVGILYAKTLLRNEQFEKCDALLSTLKILPFEGATIGRQLFQEAKLMQAVKEIKSTHYKKALQFIASAKSWPANLGVGKPYDDDIDQRLEDWLDYVCYTKLGDQTPAKQSLEKIIHFYPQVDNTVSNFLPANHLVSAWTIEKVSSRKTAEEWLQSQEILFPSNKIIRWSLQTYRNEPVELSEDEKNGAVRVLEQLMKALKTN